MRAQTNGVTIVADNQREVVAVLRLGIELKVTFNPAVSAALFQTVLKAMHTSWRAQKFVVTLDAPASDTVSYLTVTHTEWGETTQMSYAIVRSVAGDIDGAHFIPMAVSKADLVHPELDGLFDQYAANWQLALERSVEEAGIAAGVSISIDLLGVHAPELDIPIA